MKTKLPYKFLVVSALSVLNGGSNKMKQLLWLLAMTAAIPGNMMFFSQSALANTNQLKVGTNLFIMADWHTGRPFCDFARMMRPFEGFDQINGYPVEVPAGSKAFSIMGADTYNYPSGDYLVSFKGIGRLKVGGKEISNSDPLATRSATVFVSTPEPSVKWGGLVLEILESQRGNHIRDITVMLPGFHNGECNATYPFHPEFVEDIRAKAGVGYEVIRFMDWGKTNGSKTRYWSERKSPDHATQSGVVALEYMIKLANLTKVNPWFNIPMEAAVDSDNYFNPNDDYIKNFAEMIRDQLDPSLVAYIEHSNENWNFMFGHVKKAMADHCVPNDYDCYWNFLGERYTKVMRKMNTTFKNSPDRIVRVFAGHLEGGQAPYDSSYKVYKRMMEITQPGDRLLDAVSPSGYFSPYNPNVELSKSANDIYNDSLSYINNKMRSSLFDWRAMADDATARTGNNVEVILYEAGHHLDANSSLAPNLFAALKDFVANDPRMYDLYQRAFEVYAEAGVTLTAMFSDYKRNNNNNWGAQHYFGQPVSEAPASFEAILDQIQIANEPKTTDSSALVCDLNKDGVLDFGDVGILISYFKERNLDIDYNGDGVIDNADLSLYIAGCF